MALVHVHFELLGDRQYSRAFEVLGGALDDMREPLRKIHRSLVAIVTKQFATEGATPGPGPWVPLTPDYAKAKARRWGPGRPILVASGQLRDDLTWGEDAGLIELTRDKLVYGPSAEVRPDGVTNEQLATWHQKGSGHNPARVILAVPSYAKHEWDQFWLTWLRDRERDAGLR